MELYDIDVKIEDEDMLMIMLNFLPPSYKNFISSLSVGKDFIILEEVMFDLYFRELRLKAFGNGDKAFAFRLSITDSAKGQKKKKDKGSKKRKVDPKDICNYCKEPSHQKKDCPKKAKKDYVVVIV